MNMRFMRFLARIKQRLHKGPRPSLNDLDRKLARYLNFRNGFFIEAGANDGYSQSNTYFLEKKLDWRGVLIEGIPELYERCKKERARSIVHNCALVSNDFPGTTVTMHFAGLMSVVDGALKTEAEQEEHLKAGVDVQHLAGSYSIEVPARTLESILDETQDLPRIDLLSLDVEGYELNVLKGLNLSRYRPKHILVEARFFEEVNGFLEERGYEMIEKLSHHDYLYGTRDA
jgi:FkbM family methyltransferase